MKGYSHTMVVYYRSYTGSRRKIEQGFNSYEDAKNAMVKTMEALEEDDYRNVWGTVKGEKPQAQARDAEVPQGYTHYRIIAKDSFGAYVSSLLPINEDLKLIDVYKVTMPFKGAYPNPSANKRLVVRHI